MVRAETIKSPGLRPHLSITGDAISAPAKAPACMTETIFAERFAAPRSFGSEDMPNSLFQTVISMFSEVHAQKTHALNAGSVITPPMMPMSIPNNIPPKHA